jgi:hypothetical protein
MKSLAIFAALVLCACTSPSRTRGGGPGGSGNPNGTTYPDGGTGTQLPNCDPTNAPADGDQDHDGYTPAAGDCNDCDPSINPGAVQIPGSSIDYACNGMAGVVQSCSPKDGVNDPTSLAQAMDQCDSRFFKSASLGGGTAVNDPTARKVEPALGVIMPRAGGNMAYISSGIAADKKDPAFVTENQGTAFPDTNSAPHPYPNIKPNPMCSGVGGAMMSEPATVNDYTELVVKLKAPTNVKSFSFDFQFFSAEYPQFVCTAYNDEFLVLQESNGEFQSATNIAFDMQGNPVTVNNGFFTVCTNDTSNTYTQHCTKPVSDIMGTGYEDCTGLCSSGGGGSIPCSTNADCAPFMCVSGMCKFPGGGGAAGVPGGSTGWLTTTSPVTPGEDVTLHFIIYDEGDHILDSSALIDNFRWGTSVVSTPSTNPIM